MYTWNAIGRLAIGQFSSGVRQASIAAEVGTYTLSGQSVGYWLSAVPGAYTLTGNAVALSASLIGGTGTYTLTGQTAGLGRSAYLLASWRPKVRAWSLWSATGAVAIGQGSRSSAAETTYRLQGQTASSALTLLAATGSYAVTGGDALFAVTRRAEPGEYTLTGTAALLATSINAVTGVYTLTGIDIEFERRAAKIRRFPRVGSSTATARSRGAGVKVRAYGG